MHGSTDVPPSCLEARQRPSLKIMQTVIVERQPQNVFDDLAEPAFRSGR
jgi:hypothetical protein